MGRHQQRDRRLCIQKGWVFPAFGAVLSAETLFKAVVNKTPLADGFLMNLAGVILACLLIGYFEEILYWGVNLGNWLAILGGSKKLIMVAVYLLPTIKAIKRLWTEYDECYGPFVKDR